VPIDRFKQNIIDMVTHPLIKAQDPRIILITPPPVDGYGLEIAEALKGVTEVRRTPEHTKLYADAVREVGTKLGLVVLDLWTAMMKKAGWEDGQPLIGSKDLERSPLFEELMHDGLHFNPKAYEILFEEMMRVISTHWPDQTPDSLPFVLPSWEVAPK